MWILIIIIIIIAVALAVCWIDRSIILSHESNRQIKNSFKFDFQRKKSDLYPATGNGIGGIYGTEFLSEVTVAYKFEAFLSVKKMLEIERYYPSQYSLEEIREYWKKHPNTEAFKDLVRKMLYENITNILPNRANFNGSSIVIDCTYRECDREVDYTYLLWG